MTISEIGSLTDTGFGSDGHVAVTPNGELAIVVSSTDIQIVDVTDPANMTVVGALGAGLSTVSNTDTHFVCTNTHAFLPGAGVNPMVVIDFTTPSSPSRSNIANGVIVGMAIHSTPCALNAAGDRLYILGDSGSGDSLFVINVSNPTSPSGAGRCNTGVTTFMGNACGAIVSPGYFAMAGSSSPMRVADIDPDNANSFASTLAVTNLRDGICGTSDGAGMFYAIIRDVSGRQLYIADCSNPASPVQRFLGQGSPLFVDGGKGRSCRYAADGFVYTSAFGASAKLRRVDVSNPTTPVLDDETLLYSDGNNAGSMVVDDNTGVAYMTFLDTLRAFRVFELAAGWTVGSIAFG